MSETVNISLHAVDSQAIKINGEAHLTLVDDCENVNILNNIKEITPNNIKGKIVKNKKSKKHKRKPKLNTVENKEEQNGETIGSSENEQANNEGKEKENLSDKSQDLDFEMKDKKEKSKRKRKSRLSPNSEVKIKNKFKEDSNQGTIKSFLQKISPIIQGDMQNGEKNGGITEVEESLNQLNDVEKLFVSDKKEKTSSDEENQEIDPKKNKIVTESTKGESNSSKNVKNKKEKSAKKKTINKKEKIVKKKLLKQDKEEEIVDLLNENNSIESEEAEHDKEHKKVRFSEDIKEFSPELIRKNSKSKNNDLIKKQLNYDEGDEIKINNDEESIEQAKNKIKNAFTFMMDSRHKSIGQNSPGKEQEKLEESLAESYKENKKKMSTRKAIFEEWANAKGAKKRKLEDEDKGIIIENKLKKRAKRLKKMLTTTTTKDDKIVVEKKKVSQIIESDSEQSCDSNQVEELEDSNSIVIVSSTKELGCKGKRKRQKTILKEESDVINNDDLALDEEMFLNKCKKPKLLNCSDNSSSSSEKTDLKKNKQTELSSFFGIIDKNETRNNKSKLQMKKRSSENKPASRNNKKKNNLKSKLTIKKNEEDTADDFSNSQMGSEEQNEKEIDLQVEVEIKSDTFALLTPNSIKQWKMKLKVSLENVADEEIEKLILSPKPKTVEHDFLQHEQKKVGRKIKENIENLDSTDSDDEPLSSKKYYNKEKCIKPVKLAPLFMKSKPKPKLDEAAIEARRKFLYSSIPDSLKKTIEKQQTRVEEELDYQIFPTVSHITVKPTDEQLKNGCNNFWALPKVDLQLTSNELYSPTIDLLNLGAVTLSTALNNLETNLEEVQKITSIKNYLKQIKIENPNYPVYKAFKILYRKYIKNRKNSSEIIKPEIVIKKSKRGRPKKKQLEKTPPPKQSTNFQQQQEIWTDLYKPNTSEEIFGNTSSISEFKKWLKTWLEFSEEINMQRNKRKRKNSDSSDFESTDTESKDNIRLPGNTVIFCGPHGSGKTTAVYALCNELGINVLELNASSKRTGKRLLQELQEATQSHQVRKNDSNSLTMYLKKEETTSQSSDSQSSMSSKKMCLLLIEDVDIVFEQDDNFITALNQLLATSKRPVVLTTTDINCLHLRKIVAQHPVINFAVFSAKILATWFQLICLIEGLHVDRETIVELLDRNKGDARRTLLQLQFWVQSDAQLKNSKEICLKISNDENLCNNDDSLNISWLHHEEDGSEEEFKSILHSNCLETFGCFKKFNNLFMSWPVNLGNVWWNLSDLIKIPSLLSFKTTKRLDLLKNGNEEEEESIQKNNSDSQLFVKQNKEDKEVNKRKSSSSSKQLKNILNIFETMAITDVMYQKLNIDCDLEPVHTSKDKIIKDSLELGESMDNYCSNKELAYDWSHTLIEGHVKLCEADEKYVKHEDSSISDDKRWKRKQYKCDEALSEVVPVICQLDHNSVNMDYLSTIRTMARSEVIRASNNNKRRNRFYNYLRGVGINCNDSLFQTACNTFQHEN